MSTTLFRFFVSALRQNLPRHPFRSDRRVSIMSAATVEDKATEGNQSHEIVTNKNLTRFKKRFNKRQWDEPNPNKIENGETDSKRLCGSTERVKRKKMALLLGYCGVNYYGMQRNPGVRTIEEDLLKALFEAKYITEEDFNNQQNAQFQRSSRTDKGVSAARQVVSLKLPLEVDVKEINNNLPESIQVFGIKRVTNKFNSKSKCNARTYSYTLPTYAFEPSIVTDEQKKQYRIPEEKLEQLKKVLEVYKGTKSYHNFTEKKHFNDPSSLRYMMGFTVDRVFVESDMEFAVLLVKGQSFMLHQIRKMVGVAIAICRGHGDMTLLEKIFGKEKVMIPTAPGLGLVLDMVHYDRYDAKFKNSHDSLTWDEEEAKIQKFKHEHIYPIIVKGETEGNSMGTWLETKLSRHSYEPSENVPDKDDEKELGGGDDDEDDVPDGDIDSKSPADKSPTDNSPADKSPADKSPTDNSPADKSPADKSPADKSPTNNSPADKSPTDKSSADKSPVDNSSADNSPADKNLKVKGSTDDIK